MPIVKTARDRIVFKKVYGPPRKNNSGYSIAPHELVAVLRIPKGTLMRIPHLDLFSEYQRRSMKHRAARAKVLRIENMRGEKWKHVAYSRWSSSFEYRVGRIVRPTRGFSRGEQACASGIHFFFNKTQARNW